MAAGIIVRVGNQPTKACQITTAMTFAKPASVMVVAATVPCSTPQPNARAVPVPWAPIPIIAPWAKWERMLQKRTSGAPIVAPNKPDSAVKQAANPGAPPNRPAMIMANGADTDRGTRLARNTGDNINIWARPNDIVTDARLATVTATANTRQ